MKKLFALFFAFTLLFLTACNTNPPIGTNVDGSTASGSQGGNNGGTTNNGGNSQKWDWTPLQGQLFSFNFELLEIPSRIFFSNQIETTEKRFYYYSKADGNAYVYCFDPLCDHTDYTCLGNPTSTLPYVGFFDVNSVHFINNRFYCVHSYGTIYSFAFDGTDKKLEYDAKYYTDVWGGGMAYGPYIYIDSTAEEDPHIWRYNVETKEMEDLTEKTGNYVYPHFFYNGMLYGYGDKTVDTFFKADLDFNTVEEISPSIIPMDVCSGNIFVGIATKARESVAEAVKKIGISFYDLETGEQRIVTKEELGLDFYPAFIAATDEHFYFYNPKMTYLGTYTVNLGGKELTREKSKGSGTLYRMNRDGTNIVCVYDNPEYDLGLEAIIYDDKIVMKGQYIKIEDGQLKTWGGPIQVATINPDGTIGEFVGVEVLQ